jgi:hypothetical protein
MTFSLLDDVTFDSFLDRRSLKSIGLDFRDSQHVLGHQSGRFHGLRAGCLSGKGNQTVSNPITDDSTLLSLTLKTF